MWRSAPSPAGASPAVRLVSRSTRRQESGRRDAIDLSGIALHAHRRPIPDRVPPATFKRLSLTRLEHDLPGKASLGAAVGTGKLKLPRLRFGEIEGNNDPEFVEACPKRNGIDAAFLVREGDRLHRASTLLKDADGQHRVGEAIKEAHAATLLRGETHTGPLERGGRLRVLGARPVLDIARKVESIAQVAGLSGAAARFRSGSTGATPTGCAAAVSSPINDLGRSAVKRRINAVWGALLALVVAASAPDVSAGDRIREKAVRFASGAEWAIVRGRLRAHDTIDHLVSARAGQTLPVFLKADHGTAYFSVLPPQGDEARFVGAGVARLSHFRAQLATAGDYRIRVYLMRSAARRHESTDYRLKIKLAGSPPEAALDTPGSPTRHTPTSPSMKP